MTDVTEFKHLQSRLQDARKMETVAALAGGMAHQINNKLMGIVGRIEVMRTNLAKRAISDADLVALLEGCDRIALLIKYLLAYARGGRYHSESIDLGRYLQKILPDLQKQIPPDILVSWDVPPGLPSIWADPVQLQMLVEEIVRNSAEAIEGSGRIDLTLHSTSLDAARVGPDAELAPGSYLSLEVRDTGRGIEPRMLPHLFEPFFTDKFMGRGLGLAAAHGIVKGHGGWIGIDSKPGQGTRVQILFPVFQGHGAESGAAGNGS
jgi:signal transduction histidine kinase